MANPAPKLAGRTFGRLRVTRRASPGHDAHGRALWCCVCRCGRRSKWVTAHLRSGRADCPDCRDHPHCRAETIPLVGLTPRQEEAARLRNYGLTQLEIADAMGVSDRGVWNLLRKARDRAARS